MNIKDAYIHVGPSGTNEKALLKDFAITSSQITLTRAILNANNDGDKTETITIPIWDLDTAGNAASATKVKTIKTTTGNTYYPLFVDSNNDSATAETVYTNADIQFDAVNASITAKKLIVTATMLGPSTKTGGLYYKNSTNEYCLIAQGSANLWIGANETTGTHHVGSTYISAGDGDAYISRLVNSARTNYKILDAGNYNSYAPTLTGTGASGTWGINITGSAATLTTARTIWGQSFNGSADISGSMSGVTSINDTIYNIISASTAGAGLKISEINQTTNGIDLSVVNFSGGADNERPLSLQSNGSTGKVGIGTTNPSHKLHTVGDTYSSTYIQAGTYLKSGSYTQATTYVTAGSYVNATTYVRASGNDLYIGSASGSQCHEQYDATNKCLKFIFD